MTQKSTAKPFLYKVTRHRLPNMVHIYNNQYQPQTLHVCQIYITTNISLKHYTSAKFIKTSMCLWSPLGGDLMLSHAWLDLDISYTAYARITFIY